MNRQFARTALLIGEDALDRLQKSRVAVFGIGGVSSGKYGTIWSLSHLRESLTKLGALVVPTLLVPALSYDIGRAIWWPSKLWKKQDEELDTGKTTPPTPSEKVAAEVS